LPELTAKLSAASFPGVSTSGRSGSRRYRVSKRNTSIRERRSAMPLTTVSEGRVYDWSHAVGRNAARGPGFNYVQTMCLGKDGVLYAANRGNENNFGMHVNKTKLGAPGEEEWLADFCEHGDGDSHCTWPFGVAVDDQDHV